MAEVWKDLALEAAKALLVLPLKVAASRLKTAVLIIVAGSVMVVSVLRCLFGTVCLS